MTPKEKRYIKAMVIWHRITEEATAINGVIYDGEKIAEIISAALEEYEAKWMLAQRALNKIDDGFEYRLGDAKSREFVHGVLAEYTEAIKGKSA